MVRVTDICLMEKRKANSVDQEARKKHTHTETLRKLIHSMIILFHSHLDGKHFNTGRLDQCLWIAGNRSKSDEKRIDAFQSYANANDNAVDYLTI